MSYDIYVVSNANLEKATKKIGSGLTGMLMSNIMLSAVLGIAMKQIWSLINTLQILVLVPKLNIDLPENVKLTLKGLYDISNVKLIPPEYVKKGMNYVFGTGEDSEGSDVDDLILISIALVVIVIFLAACYLVARKYFPSVRAKIEVVLRMIFYNMIITAFLKAYLRLSLTSCEKSFEVIAGNMFLDEREPAGNI
jgi:hypothetical protein